MPIEAGLSQIQRAARSKQNADALMCKARYARVNSVIKGKAQLCFELEQNFIQKGLLAPVNLNAPVLKRIAGMKAILNGVVDGDADVGTVAPDLGPIDSCAEADDDCPYNRNVTHINKLSWSTISRGLRKARPSTFTRANLRAFQHRGRRDQSMDAIAQVLEYCTDMHRDDGLDSEHRTKRGTIQWIADSYHHAGDRAKDLEIPPVYQNECHWNFLQEGNKAEVTNKLTKKSFELEVPRNAELYLDIAYSYKRCKPRAKNSKFVKDLYMLYEAKFMEASIDNLAIKDRTPLKRAPGGNAFSMRGVRRRMTAKGSLVEANEELPSTTCALPSASSRSNGKGRGGDGQTRPLRKTAEAEPVAKDHRVIVGKSVKDSPSRSNKLGALVVKLTGGESSFAPPPPVKA